MSTTQSSTSRDSRNPTSKPGRAPSLRPGDLISANQAAEILGVTHHTVRRLMAAGAIPTVRIGTKIVRVHRRAVEDYIVNHTQKASI